MTAGNREAQAGAPRPLQVPSGHPAPCNWGADTAEIPRGPGGPASPDSEMSPGPGLREPCSVCPGRNTRGLGVPRMSLQVRGAAAQPGGHESCPFPCRSQLPHPICHEQNGALPETWLSMCKERQGHPGTHTQRPGVGPWSPPAGRAPRRSGSCPRLCT